MKILICGYGNIGRFIFNEIRNSSHDITIYDPNIQYYSLKETLTDCYDVAFVCVPTDKLTNGSADVSIVRDITGDLVNTRVIVIKSAVPVGTAEMLASFTGKDNIVISPEYYGTTQHSSNSPDFIVLGGKLQYCSTAADVYTKVKSGGFRIKFTDWKTAELAKYMENCFLALKVTFCAEFFDVCKEYGISYNELREIFVMDCRMGDSHTFVYPDKPYYDSHCLNKDIPAFVNMANGKAPLMEAVDRINLKKKEINS
ncbi:MAG: hypothetical protein LBR74_10165 [Eubacterium sp.]|jgi:nucleotide sugar dehydrogenase|nr:hypothetical protein [Eubacterium sp.]